MVNSIIRHVDVIHRVVMGKFVEGRLVIVMTVNDGQYYLFENFLKSCDVNLSYNVRDHLLLITTDISSEIKAVRDGNTVIPLRNISNYTTISPRYNRRAANTGTHAVINNVLFVVVNEILKLGYRVLMSDVDVVWLRSPLYYLENFSRNVDMVCMSTLREKFSR